jgi:hypothetical protein
VKKTRSRWQTVAIAENSTGGNPGQPPRRQAWM